MKYQDILPDVLAGKLVRHTIEGTLLESLNGKPGAWLKMESDGKWTNTDTGCSFDLKRDVYLLDTWEVKSDEPEEIYVWVASRSSSVNEWSNYISMAPQINNGPLNASYSMVTRTEKPLFNTGIPQKYKLIPVDEEPETYSYRLSVELEDVYVRNNGVAPDLETNAYIECREENATHKLIPVDEDQASNDFQKGMLAMWEKFEQKLLKIDFSYERGVLFDLIEKIINELNPSQ